MLKLGLKGSGINGAVKHIYFERVPGCHRPQVRITTNEGVIYVAEEDFSGMIVELFGETEGKHARRTNG